MQTARDPYPFRHIFPCERAIDDTVPLRAQGTRPALCAGLRADPLRPASRRGLANHGPGAEQRSVAPGRPPTAALQSGLDRSAGGADGGTHRRADDIRPARRRRRDHRRQGLRHQFLRAVAPGLSGRRRAAIADGRFQRPGAPRLEPPGADSRLELTTHESRVGSQGEGGRLHPQSGQLPPAGAAHRPADQ